VSAHRVGPLVDAELLEQAERPAVVEAGEHPEQPAQVHHRRVDDRHATAEAYLGVGVALVVLGAREHAGEGVVGERHPFGRPGRPARQHLDRHTGTRVGCGCVARDVDCAELVADEPATPGRERGEIVGIAGNGRDPE
jgi:hypothetical protein